jgi:hypothetical protein
VCGCARESVTDVPVCVNVGWFVKCERKRFVYE